MTETIAAPIAEVAMPQGRRNALQEPVQHRGIGIVALITAKIYRMRDNIACGCICCCQDTAYGLVAASCIVGIPMHRVRGWQRLLTCCMLRRVGVGRGALFGEFHVDPSAVGIASAMTDERWFTGCAACLRQSHCWQNGPPRA